MADADTRAPTATTRDVARKWFEALTGGDIDSAVALLDDNVEFVNYTPVQGYNTAMPWIGTYRGPRAVRDSFEVFVSTCEVRSEELVSLVVDGDEAMGVVRETSAARATGTEFQIEFVQRLRVRDGRIVLWKSYTDPSPILRALQNGAGQRAGD